MVKPIVPKQIRRIAVYFFSAIALVVLWAILDAPVEPGQKIWGVILQATSMSGRYTGGYTRIVVETEDGAVLTFYRYGYSGVQPHTRVAIVLKTRRFTRLSSYTLLY